MPTTGDGVRVYAVGDVHGCLDQLDRLLAMIDADDAARGAAETRLVFLGDLVDRGPASAQVIDRLLALAHERPSTRFLKGNHEEMFLNALDGQREALRLFCRVGGRETILSYGMSAQEYERLDYDELAERLETLVPATHRAFIAGFEDVVEIADYAFVHAGIRPGFALDQQRGADLRWIREPFLKHPGPHARMIVHGHTITPEVERHAWRIAVDTGAYATGRLSAIGLEGADSWTLTALTGPRPEPELSA